MVFCCSACGSHYNPSHPDRSFHRFPKNEDLKLKWLEAIGKTKVYKNAVICSDHFDEDDFSETIYGARKRLRPNVVPHTKHEKILVIVEADVPSSTTDTPTEENNIIDDVDLCISSLPAKCMSGVKTETNNSHKISRKRPPCNNVSETMLPMKKGPNFRAALQEADHSSDTESDTQQSELSVSDKVTSSANTDENQYKDMCKSRKVFVRLPNNGFDYFTREDFTCDHAWNKFLKTTAYARHNRRILQQASLRYKRRVEDMKNLLLIYIKKDAEKNIL